MIDAAATKPYGFMPFQPGPGVGGHCIPCDPHYLLWQLRPHNQAMPLVEGAMTAIAQRPRRVVERAAELLADAAAGPARRPRAGPRRRLQAGRRRRPRVAGAGADRPARPSAAPWSSTTTRWCRCSRRGGPPLIGRSPSPAPATTTSSSPTPCTPGPTTASSTRRRRSSTAPTGWRGPEGRPVSDRGTGPRAGAARAPSWTTPREPLDLARDQALAEARGGPLSAWCR